MRTRKKALSLLAVLFTAFGLPIAVAAQTIPNGGAIGAEVRKIMTHTRARDMAVAVLDHGQVGYLHAYGIRNAKGDPLTTDTVMYGASLTKTVFAYTVMQLVDQGKLNLDTPIKHDLDKALPSYGRDPVFPDKYGPYEDLAEDSRWEKLTPRMCLTHSTGFSNFWNFAGLERGGCDLCRLGIFVRIFHQIGQRHDRVPCGIRDHLHREALVRQGT